MAEDVAALRSEIERLEAVARQAAWSASAQGLRAAALGGEAHALRLQLAGVRGSVFWRLTLPLRIAVDLARGAPAAGSPEAVLVRRALGVARRQGVRAAWAQVRRRLRDRGVAAPVRAVAVLAPTGTLPAPNTVLAPLVVIIAELTLPQCAKYRVWQKQAHFAALGVACRVIDWRHEQDCLSAAAVATMAILYRVPGFANVQRLIGVLHEMRVPVWWEVDDLIFDEKMFVQNRNLATLDAGLRAGVLNGVTLYRDAMLACGRAIASTADLAAAMRAAGVADVAVIENALDAETLALAEEIVAARVPHDGVVICYGSGTKTHDADFAEAAQALLRLLAARPEVRLRIVGYLNLPDGFVGFAGRVEHLPPTYFAQYLPLLGGCDISIAPLEASPFNDAKSNIKFLEAAVLGIACVCTPAANFAAVVRDGQTGLLASGEAEWFAALDRLVGDAALRVRLGAAARRDVLARYAPEAVARDQVAPLLRMIPDARARGKLRVLFANVYFAPRSYGGATLVVEEMARRLHGRDDTAVFVATTLPQGIEPRRMVRRDLDGMAVFDLPVMAHDTVAEFDDPAVGELFGLVLDAVQPDVVHLHSVQWLSASVATICRERNVPYVITLHDSWWLCARQFMVREDGTFCQQTRIDPLVCAQCMHGARHLDARRELLGAALAGAALLISPSRAHKALYVANGVAPERIEVLPNGVRLPAARRARAASARMRFAYVGGSAEVKGYSVVRGAFEALARDDWELTLVDNTLSLGFSSVDAGAWRVRGSLKVVPAYTQDRMDDFFADIDVLLFPSQCKESFGLTVREALARDVWVVATNGGGPGEAITEGVNGTLIPLDSRPEFLAEAVTALLERPDRLAGYRNPLAGEIMDFAAQATRLRDVLARVSAGAQGGPA
jgi:glycosyltransferase involved in cell wall biosynthesis